MIITGLKIGYQESSGRVCAFLGPVFKVSKRN